jgi:uncharacterized protein (DUF1501 family)
MSLSLVGLQTGGLDMLDVGSFRARTCGGPSRRSFLRLASSVPLALGAQQAAGSDRSARARSVLFVFLWGAPSHLDTIDPKPNAPAEYRGPFGTIPTRTSGLRFTELLPLVAARSRLFTVCRSHVTSESGHPEAGTVALTGFKEKPGPLQPNFGSILARRRGHAGSLPPFVSLARGTLADSGRRIEGLGGGTLSASCDPFLVGCSERGEVSVPALRVLDGLSPRRIDDRKALLRKLDAAQRKHAPQRGHDWDSKHQAAHALLTRPEARKAFDLTAEKPATRGRYGQSSFGQSCLLARRLVEAGVPYVQVNYSRHPEAFTPGYEFGWDTHIYNFELLQDQHCPIFDRAFSALLDDLHERGLLSRTLVVCMGEFGRTPRISARAARDHWPQCYPSIWAGAGIEGGRTVGESDKHGAAPRSGPVITPLKVGTTIAELAGVGAEARASLRVLDGGSVIHEIL